MKKKSYSIISTQNLYKKTRKNKNLESSMIIVVIIKLSYQKRTKIS